MQETEKTESTQWRELEPEPAPGGTTAPFFTGLGIMMLLWGLIASPLLSVFGGVVLATALTRWMLTINQTEP